MSKSDFHLSNPPIVEAIVNIECDLEPGFDLASLEETGREAFRDTYPTMRKQLLHEFSIAMKSDKSSSHALRHGLQALQFIQVDDKQLVQVRSTGYSFNRLAPYDSFDAYMPEILRTWELYRSVANPIKVQSIQVRYINRIELPLQLGGVELDEYFKNGPRLPEASGLKVTGFLNQYQAVEESTRYGVATVLTVEESKGDTLPVIFDNAARAQMDIEPTDWAVIESTLQSLRELKNRVFRNTLEEKCLSRFQ